MMMQQKTQVFFVHQKRPKTKELLSTQANMLPSQGRRHVFIYNLQKECCAAVVTQRSCLSKVYGGGSTSLTRSIKPNLQKKVLFSPTDFLPWEILLIKKLEIEKTKTTFVIQGVPG